MNKDAEGPSIGVEEILICAAGDKITLGCRQGPVISTLMLTTMGLGGYSEGLGAQAEWIGCGGESPLNLAHLAHLLPLPYPTFVGRGRAQKAVTPLVEEEP